MHRRNGEVSQAVGTTHITVCCRVNLAIGRGGHLHHSIRCRRVSWGVSSDFVKACLRFASDLGEGALESAFATALPSIGVVSLPLPTPSEPHHARPQTNLRPPAPRAPLTITNTPGCQYDCHRYHQACRRPRRRAEEYVRPRILTQLAPRNRD